MAQYKVRLDTGPAPEPLQDRPFAALSGLPRGEGSTGPAVELPYLEPAVRRFAVGRTRKGGYGISIERRPNGKQVTVLRNVQGDAEALLTLLKKRCGAGGVVRGDHVELQGDHRAAVDVFLNECAAATGAERNMKL